MRLWLLLAALGLAGCVTPVAPQVTYQPTSQHPTQVVQQETPAQQNYDAKATLIQMQYNNNVIYCQNDYEAATYNTGTLILYPGVNAQTVVQRGLSDFMKCKTSADNQMASAMNDLGPRP
jgi:PBP1b-binding outer membrane lipoprotein LpoB